jgi:hypothetical protein
LAQIYPPQFDRRPRLHSDPDWNDAVGQKYPGVVRIGLLIGVLAMSWSGVFAGALMASRLIRHLTH